MSLHYCGCKYGKANTTRPGLLGRSPKAVAQIRTNTGPVLCQCWAKHKDLQSLEVSPREREGPEGLSYSKRQQRNITNSRTFGSA